MTYKGVLIRQWSRKTRSGLWLSTASFKFAFTAFTLTQHTPSHGGRFDSFITEQDAEGATAKYVREYIDKMMPIRIGSTSVTDKLE